MKKVITTAILFSLFFISTAKAQAFTLDEAFTQIADLKVQVLDLQSQLSAAVSLSKTSTEVVSTTKTSSSIAVEKPTLVFSSTQTIAPNSKSDDVKLLQQVLKDAGHFKAEITGFFGAKTEMAVRSFQKANMIPVTGVAGLLTKNAILSSSGAVERGPTGPTACNPSITTAGPATTTVFPGDANVPFLNVRITAPINCTVSLNSMTLGYSGTLTPSLVQNVRVFQTTNTFVGGTQIGTVFTDASGALTMSFPTITITSGTAKYFAVRANIGLTALTGTTARFGITGLGSVSTIPALPLWGNPMIVGVKISVLSPDLYGSFSTVGGPSVLSITYTIKPNGQDIYLDKDVLMNVANSTLGAQLITITETTNSAMTNIVPFSAEILNPPTLTSLTPSVILLPGGTYKIPNGQTAQFKISTSLKAPVTALAPYVRYYKMTWNMFGFSTTDVNGTVSRANPLSASGAIGGVSLN